MKLIFACDLLLKSGSHLICYVPGLTNFAEMFHFLMDLGTRMEYNLVIDEFQEFYYINQEIYSLMQDTWDRLRKQSHVNLIK